MHIINNFAHLNARYTIVICVSTTKVLLKSPVVSPNDAITCNAAIQQYHMVTPGELQLGVLNHFLLFSLVLES